MDITLVGTNANTLHQSTLQKLQKQLQQTGANTVVGADKIIWDETEQVMRKDGFEKLPLVKDSTLSGINAEFCVEAVREMYKDFTGKDLASDMYKGFFSFPFLATEESRNTYNIYSMAIVNRCKNIYQGEGLIPLDYLVNRTLYREEPAERFPHAEEIRTNFANSIDEFVKKLQEDRASGAISEETYKVRQNMINETYDKFAYEYGNFGMTDYYYMKVSRGTDVFSAWEDSLNDIKMRYERGDFGFEEGVYEKHLAAWSTAFDEWAVNDARAFNPTMLMGIATPYFPGEAEKDAAVYRKDLLKLYENAKEHLLQGNTAYSLTDDILNKGLVFTNAADRRFFYSDQYNEILTELDRQLRSSSYDRYKTQSQDKKEWEDLYERFALQIKSKVSLSETLRNALLQYFDFASIRLPQFFKGNFIPE
ncbi:MAG: hypothetical protein LBL49_05975 [Clostridiales Family XIII bacterium]|nr:hypothetical protein [Clostridiales Family XIII bacterium]